jgi:CDP-paratose 2-epimerase
VQKQILITGGAGFIGVNSADAFFKAGWNVCVLDNLSRKGAQLNLDWLRSRANINFEKVDIRDADAVSQVFKAVQPDVVLHLAAQVAVTTSVINPREDFEINAAGSFNVLEAIRIECPHAFFINASTNKVYGKMEDLGVVERNGRYEYADLVSGIAEDRSLDFHSPYGCSKGVADQYTIDYARVYGLQTVTLRQSCIYGPRQFGIEDQGWVAWFTIAALLDKEITVYGNGMQIRDVLHVDDLVWAYQAAIENQTTISGKSFNIGGGPENTLSLLELLEHLRTTLDKDIKLRWDDWRPGDQPVFVCDVTKARQELGWQPKVTVDAGVLKLIEWVKKNSELFA